VAAIFLKAKMTARRWTGLLIGLSGVVLLSEVWENNWQQPEVLLGTGLLLTGAIINASTSVYIRGHDWTMDPIQALPWQMGLAAVPLLILALAVDGPPQIDWTAELSLIMAYQAVLASGVAFLAQVVVLRNISAVSANLTMMGVPVIGVVSSAAFLDEQVTVAVVLGMLLIMTGVMVNVLGEVRR
jgi:drug/metabolite transporter (DMT)-like permease